MKGIYRVTVSCGTKFHSDYMAFQLEKHGLLESVVTSHPKSRYTNRVKLNSKKIRFLFPIFAISHFLKKILKGTNRISKWLDYKMPILFDVLASKHLNKSDLLISWAWSGLQSIQQIKSQGGIAIVEECGSCNKFQNEILNQEYHNLGLNFIYPTPEQIVERELKEVKLADYILCPSRHVAQSFIQNGIASEKCIIIPYGVNPGIFKPLHLGKKEFTIIFVGTVGVRKGLIYLFKALEILKDKFPVNCILVGKIEDQFLPVFKQYSHLFNHKDQIQHHDLVNYYNKASVFVFPSLDEGMAYVQLEAMACGLPVICTPNSGGDSVVEHGTDGFIVPVRDPDALAEKIEYLYLNKEIQQSMSKAAHSKALSFTWDAYGEKLARFINSIPQKNIE
jgi:glycosyltransferase involved in cell wall biosynthesis